MRPQSLSPRYLNRRGLTGAVTPTRHLVTCANEALRSDTLCDRAYWDSTDSSRRRPRYRTSATVQARGLAVRRTLGLQTSKPSPGGQVSRMAAPCYLADLTEGVPHGRLWAGAWARSGAVESRAAHRRPRGRSGDRTWAGGADARRWASRTRLSPSYARGSRSETNIDVLPARIRAATASSTSRWR